MTPREELSKLLKESRLQAGFRTQAALAGELHLSRPVLSRAENPAYPVPSDEVMTEWARATGADLGDLRELAARASGGTPEWFGPYLAAEQSATLLRLWSPALVPGPLQTESYARAVLAAYGHAPGRLAELLRVRIERQAVLGRARVTVVIDASVLSRLIGSPAIMAEQCGHVADLAEMPNVALHVVPEGSNTGAWAAISIASHGPVATVCLTTGTIDVTTTAPAQIDMATEAWDRIMGAALPCADSVEYVRQWEAKWKEMG